MRIDQEQMCCQFGKHKCQHAEALLPRHAPLVGVANFICAEHIPVIIVGIG